MRSQIPNPKSQITKAKAFAVRYEFSAGGIVYKIIRHPDKNDAQILVCQHSQHHGWVFPKGLIGDKIHGESKENTAVREVQEETGIIGRITKALPPISYWYIMDGIKRKKTVYYFLMEYVGGDITKHDWEMENVEWLPLEGVTKRLTYESDRKIWQNAQERIKNLESRIMKK